MKLDITYVDSFTDKIFAGNPAAVCVTEEGLDPLLMQKIATELNLSETAFLYPRDRGYHLRWFTPKVELALCGHATLASAHVLWEQEIVTDDKISFHTLSGELTAVKSSEGIELNFPVELVEVSEFPESLVEALGVVPIFMGRTKVRYFAELNSASEVRNLNPDIFKISSNSPGRIIVTARSDDPQYDFISRYFAPGIGIPEDPVTGSAHCALASYWSNELNKTNFKAYQASSRGGELLVSLDEERVKLVGKAITVMNGGLRV